MYDIGFRNAAIKLYKHLGNMKKVANILDIGVATIWRWLRYGIERKVVCNREPKKLKDMLLAFIEARMLTKPTITQKELQKDIFKMLNVRVSRQCVATGIRKLNFSRKRLSKRGITNKQVHAESRTFIVYFCCSKFINYNNWKSIFTFFESRCCRNSYFIFSTRCKLCRPISYNDSFCFVDLFYFVEKLFKRSFFTTIHSHSLSRPSFFCHFIPQCIFML